MKRANPDLQTDLAKRLFGARVRVLRERDGRTQEALAEAVGLQPATVSQIENGHEAPRFASIVRLAQALGEPVESLFAFDTVGAPDKDHARATRELLRLLRDQPPDVVRTVTVQARALTKLLARRDGAA